MNDDEHSKWATRICSSLNHTERHTLKNLKYICHGSGNYQSSCLLIEPQGIGNWVLTPSTQFGLIDGAR